MYGFLRGSVKFMLALEKGDENAYNASLSNSLLASGMYSGAQDSHDKYFGLAWCLEMWMRLTRRSVRWDFLFRVMGHFCWKLSPDF